MNAKYKLIKWMKKKDRELKEKYNFNNYFLLEDVEDILKWDKAGAESTWRQMGIYINEEQNTTKNICIFCVYYIYCTNCVYANIHGTCDCTYYYNDNKTTWQQMKEELGGVKFLALFNEEWCKKTYNKIDKIKEV